jgi:AraC family transcriptional regulator
LSTGETLRLAPGRFFGGARLFRSGHGVEVSHRIAAGVPDEVLVHTHADAHFILVTGGDYVSAAGQRPADGQPVLVYNPPGTTHRDHFERGRGSFFAISLEPSMAAQVLTGTSIPDAPLYLTAPSQQSIALRIACCCRQDSEGLSLEAWCMELLGSMGRGARTQPAAPPGWLRRALELMHDRYTGELTIAAIARSVGVHPIQLARSFRRHLRCSPGEFARHRRLERALHLLSRSLEPLSAVAVNSGFADQSHFSRTFTRYFGLPPGEYRALVRPGPARSARFQIDKTGSADWTRVAARVAAARAMTRRLR